MRRRRRGTSKEFLWPFILMIGVGLIFVLIVQLVMSFFTQKEAEMRNKANFYIDRGSAEIMEWGEKDWSKAYDGGVILEGDSIKTKAASRGVLTLYNGTEIRFWENTQVTIMTLESKSSGDYLILDVEKGEIWINQLVNEKGAVDVTVEIDNMNVYSTSTEFAVENREVQAVRVVDGNVMVELVDKGKISETVIDEVKVGVGQQLEMSASDVEDLLARRNMDFLVALSDDWKSDDFYEWNVVYESVVESQQSVEESVVESEESTEESPISDLQSPEEEVDYEDPVLTLTNPEISPYILEEDQIYIMGTVLGFASKIVVTSYTKAGTQEDYKLNLFNAGDTEWSYNAAVIYDNLHEGENEYFVTAYDFDGFEADQLAVTINVPEIESIVESEESMEESVVESQQSMEESVVESQQSEVESPISDDQSPEELGCELTAPAIVNIDWEEWDEEVFELTKDAVRIDGTVECAYGIVINEYQLTLFEPGDTEWAYVASLEYNNLFEGETEYAVYSVDEQGNRSEPVYFWLNYVPEEESPISDDQSPEE